MYIFILTHVVLNVRDVRVRHLERLVGRREYRQRPQLQIRHGHRVLFDQIVKLDVKRRGVDERKKTRNQFD